MSATKPTLTDKHAGGPYSVPPEPKRWPSIALAVGVHALLLAFLVIGVSWQNHEPVAVEAEVWDTTVQTAAPPPPPAPEPEPQPDTPPPPPEPVQKAVEPPPPPVEQPVAKQPAPPDIALEKKRKDELKRKQQQQEEEEREREQERLDRIAEQKRADDKKARLAAEKKQRELEEKKEQERELAEQKAKEQKAQEQKAKELAQKEADDKKKKLEKEKADKLAKAKADKAEQARLDKQRQEDLKRMMAAAAGSGSANSTGAAEKSSAPRRDNGYIAAITAAVKSHAAYSGDDPGNPVVTFHVDQLPTGDIMSVRKTKSSGIPAFDDAIERAIKQASPLPKKKDGTVERSLEINFHMKDMQ